MSAGTVTTGGPALIFAFDDGWLDIYTESMAYMDTKGIKGTCYVITSKTGTAGYMNEAQLVAMDANGWDIGNHSRNHTNFVLSALTQEQIEAELSGGASDLVDFGLPEASLHVAYPGGGYNAASSAAMAATGMRTGRTLDVGEFVLPVRRPYELQATNIPNTMTLEQAKAVIDAAMVAKRILIVVFHRIVETAVESYDWPIADFQALIDYVVVQGYPVKTMTELYPSL